MQPRVFSAPWFARHQRSLRAALNTPGLGRELRAALGVQPRGRLVCLLPHANVVRYGDRYVADFRTHARIAKRLYHAGLPLWQLLHWFDQRIANPLVPAFNLGFDTLTRTPDAGDPGTTTCDAVVWRHGPEDWATLRAGAGTNLSQTGASTQSAIYFEGHTVSSQFLDLSRNIFTFDTSIISAGSTIFSATLSLVGAGASTDTAGTAPDVDIYAATPASDIDIVAADFSQIGTTSMTGSPIAFAGWLPSASNVFTMNAAGRGNITMGGISRYGCRNANYDVAGVAPTWVSGSVAELLYLPAEASGTANDPTLTAEFSLAASGSGRGGFCGFQAAALLSQGWD